MLPVHFYHIKGTLIFWKLRLRWHFQIKGTLTYQIKNSLLFSCYCILPWNVKNWQFISIYQYYFFLLSAHILFIFAGMRPLAMQSSLWLWARSHHFHRITLHFHSISSALSPPNTRYSLCSFPEINFKGTPMVWPPTLRAFLYIFFLAQLMSYLSYFIWDSYL